MKLKGNTEIRFINDATAFGVGESWAGSTAGFQRSIAITLGTGFGSAFIENGIPVLERNDVPQLGCLWHLPCKDGIADEYFSTRWYINSYNAINGKVVSGVKELVQIAQNDLSALKLFHEFGTNLGIFLAPWVKKFAAECIVIGGNIGGAWSLFSPAFVGTLQQNGADVKVKTTILGESSAILGSARLMDNDFWGKIEPLLSKM